MDRVRLEEWLCLGLVELSTGKLGTKFDGLLDGKRADVNHIYSRVKEVRPGEVILVEVTPDAHDPDVESCRFGGKAKSDPEKKLGFVRMWADRAELAAIQEASRAVDIAKRSDTELKKLKSDQRLGELLEPLRRVYQKTNPQTQAAMEVALLRALRSKRGL